MEKRIYYNRRILNQVPLLPMLLIPLDKGNAYPRNEIALRWRLKWMLKLCAMS